MDLYSEGFYIVGTIGSSRKIWQVKLYLIPSLIQSHGHGTYEWLDSGGALVVRRSESSSNVFVIQHLYLECEVFFKVLNNHDQEGQFYPESFLWVDRRRDKAGADIGSHDFQHAGLNICIGDSFDVSISHLFIPDLQGLWPNRVEDR